jgi:hypothetical protein
MKITNRIVNGVLGVALPLLVLASTNGAMAQAWQNVLVYQLAAGKGAVGYGLAADTLGNVFSGGYGQGASVNGTSYLQGLVLKTDTTEANWFLSDDTNPNPGTYQSWINSLGFDSNGNLYSVGQLWPPGYLPPYWEVRKSADRGVTWTTVDLFQYPVSSVDVDPTGFIADNAGNIYVVGWASSAGNGHWLVRKSTDGGQTWANVDDMTGGTIPSQGCFVPGVGLFVVGSGSPSVPGVSGWTVRRSLNGGATWTTVDAPFGSSAGAWSVASDSAGNIYVAGSVSVTTTTTKPKSTVTYSVWVTRESTDGGNTWATVDTYILASNQSAVAHGVGVNATGNVVVVGQASDSNGVQHWIVRAPDSNGVWRTLDNFTPPPSIYRNKSYSNSAIAYSVVTDAAGNLLVTGSAGNYPYGLNWIVRRLPLQ